MGNVKMNELWRDRKRYFGLPLSFTKYSLTEDRIFMETGLLNTELEEILLYRVRDIGMKISLAQRFFGVGTVILVSSDKTAPKLELKNIRSPRLVKEQIHQQVEEMKLKRRLRVGEVLEDGTEDEFDEDEDDFPSK